MGRSGFCPYCWLLHKYTEATETNSLTSAPRAQLATVGNELPAQHEINMQLGKLGNIMRVQFYFVSL